MNSQELYDLIDNVIYSECRKIMKGKGESYSGLKDKLGNFKRTAELADNPILKVWLTFFVKHFDSVCSYVRGEYNDTEPIEGRFYDMINYCCLALGIIKEQAMPVPGTIIWDGLNKDKNKDINHEEYNPESEL